MATVTGVHLSPNVATENTVHFRKRYIFCQDRCAETVGLRTRAVWDQRNRSRSWSSEVWCCVLWNSLVTLVVIMILKDTATFWVLFIVSLFCA